jgi:L-ascorbate metabolism protein UlaG (beta-lactamase superfamily)
MNPEEAVKAFMLSGAEQAVAHHWGTFQLTNEALRRPPDDLQKALQENAIAPERFLTLRPGEVLMCP